MTPYYEHNGITIYHSEALATLKQMSNESINCVVTSPPYWGMRDYGVEGQIGLEKTPEVFVTKLTDIFREVRRVLRSDGTCWVNIGDTYWGGKGASNYAFQERRTSKHIEGKQHNIRSGKGEMRPQDGRHQTIKPKDLVGIPWMLAFALRADGWWLRQDIIWAKPNPMPESVTDRCTKSHEHIFLLSKCSTYHFDNEAIKEDAALERRGDKSGNKNKRDVWSIVTENFSEAHFATYPQDLVKPCILAGCPAGGVVFDPFGGAMTTMLVARYLNRKGIAIELNAEYIEIGKRRISQNVLEFPETQ